MYYQLLFYFMEDEGILDDLDNLHLVALHHVYLPRIEEKLDIWNTTTQNAHHYMYM